MAAWTRSKFFWVMLLWAVISGIALFFALQMVVHPQLRYNSGLDRLKHPFDTRVRYRIGKVDERFELSHQDVKQLTNEAVQIWHTGTKKQWFVYDDTAQLTINFIYDERQAQSNAKADVERSIDRMIQTHDQQSQKLHKERMVLKQEFDALQIQIHNWQNQHEQLQQQMSNATNNEQYQQLLSRYQQLLGQKTQLNQQIQSHQYKQHAFNQSIKDHNQYAQNIDQAIDDARQRFVPHQFHKGVFNGKQINIYQFQSLDDLRLTLAHELGHALGIGHNDDPTALMYPYAQQQNLQNFQLKPADIALLESR